MAQGKDTAVLGGGCFWCMEAVFAEVNGVEKVESGYSGGTVVNPSYEDVCGGETGHAEVVRITFDPKVISFKDILQIFFAVHDPTTPNRQGHDVGTQYRSAILYSGEEQRVISGQVIKEINAARIFEGPVVTEVVPLRAFYKAEDYHQEYFKKNPQQAYCQVVIAPKLAEFREHYSARLRER